MNCQCTLHNIPEERRYYADYSSTHENVRGKFVDIDKKGKEMLILKKKFQPLTYSYLYHTLIGLYNIINKFHYRKATAYTFFTVIYTIFNLCFAFIRVVCFPK